MTEFCYCNCGYICGGLAWCGQSVEECMKEHWVKDCKHDFTGPVIMIERSGTRTCKHCGMPAMQHDVMVGP